MGKNDDGDKRLVGRPPKGPPEPLKGLTPKDLLSFIFKLRRPTSEA